MKFGMLELNSVIIGIMVLLSQLLGLMITMSKLIAKLKSDIGFNFLVVSLPRNDYSIIKIGSGMVS